MNNLETAVARHFEANFVEAPPQLVNKILNRIEQAKRAKIRHQLELATMALAASFLLSAAVIFDLIRQAAATGFGEFLTTIFSDLSLALANWQDYGSYLLESMPVELLIVSLITIGLIFITGLMAAGAAKRFYNQGYFLFKK